MAPPPWFFNILTFLVSHIFLWPIFLSFIEAYLIYAYGRTALIILIAINVAYFSTYFSNAHLTGSRYSAWFTTVWRGCHQYFPVRTLMWDGKGYTDEPTPAHDVVYNVNEKTFVFAIYPHGALPVGGAVFRPQISRWKTINEKLRVGVASIVLWLPFVRDFFLWFGSIDVSWGSMMRQLKKGNSVMMFPGGIKEQLWVCKPGEDVVYLRRKGFVKLALLTGSPLVPIYVFGERKCYIVMEKATRWMSKILKKLFNAGVPFVRGRWFTLMPFAIPVTLVIGPPMELPRVEEKDLTEEIVDKYHAKHVEALRKLYDEHKEACGYGDITLKIV